MDPSEKEDFPKVHEEEKEEIRVLRGNRNVPEDGDTYLGLALSGGGIRSATFNLGVLQTLAKLNVLCYIDYLSTVSGGGYIGSWLVAWIKRAGLENVTAGLQPDWHKHADGKAAPEIEFLRDYSNYLTPHVGFFTTDTWSVIVTYIRNLLLNLLILVATSVGVLLIPHWLVDGSRYLGGCVIPWFAVTLIVAAIILFGIFVKPAAKPNPPPIGTSNNKESGQSPTSDQSGDGEAQGWIVLWIGLCAFAGAYLGVSWIADKHHSPHSAQFVLLLSGIVIAVWLVVGLLLIIPGLGKKLDEWAQQQEHQPLVAWISLASYALLSIPAAAWVIVDLACGWHHDRFALLSWGVPVVVLFFLLTAALQVGLTGLLQHNEVREWMARLGAWLLILGLAWAGLFGIALFGPLAVLRIWGWLAGTLTVAWAAHTIAGVWSAFNPKTGNGGSAKWLNLLAVTAPPVFVVGLLMWLSYGIYRVSPRPAGPSGHLAMEFLVEGSAGSVSVTQYFHSIRQSVLSNPWVGLVALGLLILAYLLSLRIDINEFSMHTFYRNRLVRCYLGATRPSQYSEAPDRRWPNRFTGFDPKDDVPISELACSAKASGECKGGYGGPYPILCAALNLTHGERMAWQERKAESFTFTPRYCGGTISGENSYLPTTKYSYPPKGVYLGTAMAISGAAVSPLAGFHYSSAAGFLMTVFNARLGQWLANPRMDKFTRNRFGPRAGFWWLLRELIGLMNDEAPYVNLSDGGLFENLGVYELVRRRVRYIIACDAGEDRDLKFGDLGTAIRRCRSDFGVEIEIKLDDIQRDSTTKLSKSSFAVGTIHYSPGPPYDPHADGKLLYLKASLTKDDPPDVLEYHSNNDDFPHQSTADQWFDESQFESYRRLGQWIAKAAFEELVPGPARDKLFNYLDQKKPSSAWANASLL